MSAEPSWQSVPVVSPDDLPDALPIEPLSRPPDTTVHLPGSKSITNRALLCAALAEGESVLERVLVADDTLAMVGAVRALGAQVDAGGDGTLFAVEGVGPAIGGAVARVDARDSGTTARFILPAAALTPTPITVDGSDQLRRRPFRPLLSALSSLGATVRFEGRNGALPVTVSGPLRGSAAKLPGHVSSQFLSGLLMTGPLLPDGLSVELTSPLVSEPYVAMTVAVMRAFGAQVDGLTVAAGRYRPTTFRIEPDASAASYFFAAAALGGGRVTVEGLGTASLQGDVAFVDVLEQMGAAVERSPERITVRGTGELHGVEVNLANLSDTAQTLAAVAVFADSPTVVRGVGFIRAKETDRLAAIVAELRRAGIEATEDEDGFTVVPGDPKPVAFETYHDHRMAMSLALVGLRAPGVVINGPHCVAKTFPDYFDALNQLR